MKISIKLFLWLCCLTAATLNSQIDPIYSLYRFNNNLVNPAEAGQHLNAELSIQGRTQWVGIEGNPTTYALTYSAPLNENTGAAVSIVYDQVGPVKTLNLNADYSYKLMISKNFNVVSALRITAQNQSVNFSDLTFIDRNDESFGQSLNTGILGNGGFGLKFNYKKHTIGIAQPRILRYTFSGNEDATAHNNRNYLYISYSGKYSVNEDWIFNPQILTRTSIDIPLSLDFTTVFNYKKSIDFGLIYRIESAIGILAGLRTKSGIQFGYIYEYPTNVINTMSFMTHEFSLKYGINDLFQKDVVNPRRVK